MNMETKNANERRNQERNPITIESIISLFSPDSHPDLHIFKFLEKSSIILKKSISDLLTTKLMTHDSKDRLESPESAQVLRLVYDFFSRIIKSGRWCHKMFSPKSGSRAMDKSSDRSEQPSDRSEQPSDRSEIDFDWTYSDCFYIRSVDYWEVVEAEFEAMKVRFVITNGREYSSLRSASSNQETNARKVILSCSDLEWVPSQKMLIINLKFMPSSASNESSVKRSGSQNAFSSLSEQIIQKIREIQSISDGPAVDGAASGLEKVLKKSLSKNPTDIYIFKNLQARLRSEFEIYFATKIAEFTEQETSNKQYIADQLDVLMRAKRIIEAMIPIVASNEDRLRDLWIESKEISKEEYLITLDIIDPKWYPRILENQRQIEQWKALYALEITSLSQIYTNTLFGKSVLKLPVDTALFDDPLHTELITIAKQTSENGLLINANNFDGLIYLKSLYQNQIKCIYIDPPYNTGNEFFVFKDNYSHSSWLTMMENRLTMAHDLLTNDGYILISIDYNELNNLLSLMNRIFGPENLVEIFAWAKTLTPPSLSVKSRRNVEYIVCYEKKKTNVHYKGPFSAKSEDQPILNSGNPRKVVKFPAGTVSTKLKFGEYKAGQYPKAHLLKDITIKDGKIVEDLEVEIESKWSQQKINEEVSQGTRFVINSELFSIRFIRKPTIGFNAPKTLILGKAGEEEAEIGTNETSQKEIKNYGLSFDDYPKPIGLIKYLIGFNTDSEDIILDFFAGSGTTADAVINLNQTKYREGNRKYILIESEKYFDTDLKARIQKRIISNEWENGKPKNLNGISHRVRYLSLYSFYDLLQQRLKSELKT